MRHARYNRRHFLKGMGLGAASVVLPAFADTSRSAIRGRRPNVLFLFTDDQRFDTLNALDNPEIMTPNMDRLVRNGTVFTHAHIMGGTSAAVCAPSRAMLLTGRTLFHIPPSFAVPWEVKGPERGACPYPTFPEVFRQAGYATFATGKWHNDPPVFARGFTHGGKIFFGGMSDHLKVPVNDFDPEGKYPKNRTYVDKTFSSELFSNAAVEFLEGLDGHTPFLMYVSYTSPHDPRMAPKEFVDLYPPEKISLPANFLPEHPFDNGELRVRDEQLAPWPRTPEIVRREMAGYYAMITHLDAHIGRVLHALEQAGHADDTIIVFAGDNGLAVGQHGLLGKQNLYEHSVRVPLVFCGPGIPKGERRDALCYLLDVFPSLCELAGFATPESVEGKSLAPVIRGETTQVRDSLFAAYRHFQRMVRKDDWKLIRYNVKGVDTTQLFNLRDDPWETTNLAEDPAHAQRVEALTALLRKWMAETDDPCDLDKPGWRR